MNKGALVTKRAVVADCEAREISQNDVARELDYDPGAFSKVLSGKQLAGLGLSLRIKEKYGTPLEAWLEPADPTEAA